MKIGGLLVRSAVLLCLCGGTGGTRPDALREAPAVTCMAGTSERVSMRSTDRLPEASGSAKVERRGGTTEIDVELDSMKPASLFGGDFNTYVLWVVPPTGPAENLGEIVVDGTHAKQHASTPAGTFTVMITAEPHFLVTAPSAFLVLANN